MNDLNEEGLDWDGKDTMVGHDCYTTNQRAVTQEEGTLPS